MELKNPNEIEDIDNFLKQNNVSFQWLNEKILEYHTGKNLPNTNNIKGLQGKSVNFLGVKYNIYGLIHDTPYIKINPELKKEVREVFSNSYVICEDGFNEWFDKCIPFNEIDYFHYNNVNWKQVLKNLKFIFQKTEKNDNIINIISNIKELNIFRDYIFKTYLPEPFGINYRIYQHNKESLKKFSSLPNMVKRYLYEAKFAVDYATNHSLDEINIAVGASHELPLEYLIKNFEVIRSTEIK